MPTTFEYDVWSPSFAFMGSYLITPETASRLMAAGYTAVKMEPCLVCQSADRCAWHD